MGLRLELLDGDYCVSRLDPGTEAPQAPEAGLFSVTRTDEEVSVVCPAASAPEGARTEGPFAALRVAGTLDFSLTGVLSGLTTPLAAAGVSVFAISTFDTDHLLVPRDLLGPAAEALREAGHEVPSYDRRVIEPGKKAPDFKLPDQDGKQTTLKDLLGQPLVLYFYPRADTPGCTTQACSVRDHRGDYEAAGARVVGVSPDSVSAVKKFADKHDLGFTLLADEDHAVADKYGTWVEKSMYGRRYMGVQRATFIIDEKGKVAHVLPKVQPKKHDGEVLKALAEL